jgi:DNA phosphorothioation-dependent restriction protein DptG
MYIGRNSPYLGPRPQSGFLDAASAYQRRCPPTRARTQAHARARARAHTHTHTHQDARLAVYFERVQLALSSLSGEDMLFLPTTIFSYCFISTTNSLSGEDIPFHYLPFYYLLFAANLHLLWLLTYTYFLLLTYTYFLLLT